MTKGNFYGKPTPEDYNNTFGQLTTHFLKQGLKSLVCPPMRCVRDQIKPDLFMKNIIDFQLTTKAKIYIVVNGHESPKYFEKLRELPTRQNSNFE